MAEIEIITGDLLTLGTQYIAHQCNCVTDYSKGLAAALFARFPYADTYRGRWQPSQPGTIAVFGDGLAKHYVINLYAQYNPGRPRSASDSRAQRLAWFNQCLTQIEAVNGLEEVAFPWGIGCGLAGGNWTDYEQALWQWAALSKARRVSLVKLASF